MNGIVYVMILFERREKQILLITSKLPLVSEQFPKDDIFRYSNDKKEIKTMP